MQQPETLKQGPFGAPLPIAFVDGSFVPRADATLSLNANVVSYGTGTFEGIRVTWNEAEGELYLLEAAGHFDRLRRSARVLGLDLNLTAEELTGISVELLRRNDVRTDAYLRPLYILADDGLPVKMHGYIPQLSITVTPVMGDYVPLTGLRCKVSSWRRPTDVVMPARAKICGSYVTNALAKTEAHRAGYDEAIMLTSDGMVAEGSTSNVFLRHGETWSTPPGTDDILEGITRGQVLTLLAEAGASTVERRIHRSELHTCDEMFLCGTAALVAPVTEVDNRPIGAGSVQATSSELLRALRAIARRERDDHHDWTVPVYKEDVR